MVPLILGNPHIDSDDKARVRHRLFVKHLGVVLKVRVKGRPLGIHFLNKGILTTEGAYIMAILGTVF